MFLEEAGGDGVGHFAFDRSLHDGGLVFAKRHDADLAGFEDRAHAHCYRLGRHVLLAVEIAPRIAPRYRIERSQARAAVTSGPGFVEADVAGPADAEQLQVDAPRATDELLVVSAILLHLVQRHRAVRDVDVLRRHVDVVEKWLVPPEAVARW